MLPGQLFREWAHPRMWYAYLLEIVIGQFRFNLVTILRFWHDLSCWFPAGSRIDNRMELRRDAINSVLIDDKYSKVRRGPERLVYFQHAYVMWELCDSGFDSV